jgi:hypothetical protein
MFKEIEQKADWLQSEIWILLAEKRGIARTEENCERFRSIWAMVMNETAKSLGLDESLLTDCTPVENVLALEAIFALAIVSTAHAERAAAKEDAEALDLLVVAAETTGIVRGLLTMSDREAEKSAGAILARMRHKENRDLKAFAISYWRDNIDPNLSAAKAADKLVGVVNLSHKKLAEIIAAEKKKTA